MLTKNKALITFFGIIGNIFEWYEFSLFAFFAPIIAHQFFPNENQLASLIQVFSVFAVGYIMRPIGALCFGYYGDKLGRKKMLATSISVMALATTLIGLIPSYQTIGILSCILLILCRMAQGFVLGGEYSGSVVYLIEQSSAKWRNFWGSFALFGCYSGMLLGSLVSAIVLHLTKDTAFQDYAWRFCFLFGIFLGLIGIFIRRALPETRAFTEAKQEHQLYDNPIVTVFKNHYKTLTLGIGITLLPAVTSYTLLSYLPTHLSQLGNLSLDKILTMNALVLLVMISIIPIISLISCFTRKKPFLFLAPILIGCTAYSIFQLLMHHDFAIIFMAEILLATFCCFSEALIPAFLASLFPVGLRYTGIAVCLNVANGFFGGTAPLVATYMIAKTHNLLAPSYYLIGIAFVSFISTVLLYSQNSKQRINSDFK